MTDKLQTVIDTLNHVSVQGEQNICYMLGAIQALNQIVIEEKGKEVEADG